MKARTPAPELIVALDVSVLRQACELVKALRPAVSFFKVGLELFAAAGPSAVEMVRGTGARVMLDLKFHDIPNTVAGAVRNAARLGAGLVTLHVAGGEVMVRAAVDAARRSDAGPLLFGVTRLTSEAPPRTLEQELLEDVVRLARLGAGWGLDGAVVSVREAAKVRALCPPGFRLLTPGIRPAGADPEDQGRLATPAEAVRAGSDFLVVGRPITRHPDPLSAARSILKEMKAARGDTAGMEGVEVELSPRVIP